MTFSKKMWGKNSCKCGPNEILRRTGVMTLFPQRIRKKKNYRNSKNEELRDACQRQSFRKYSTQHKCLLPWCRFESIFTFESDVEGFCPRTIEKNEIFENSYLMKFNSNSRHGKRQYCRHGCLILGGPKAVPQNNASFGSYEALTIVGS